MTKRSQEWLAEFGDIAEEQSEYVRLLILDGSIEICPVCLELSAYAFQDTTAYDKFPNGNCPPSYKPAKDSIALISVASGDEWECGHCGSHIMEANSPINHPAYTHEDD